MNVFAGLGAKDPNPEKKDETAAVATANPDTTITSYYTSLPIQRYQLGEFHFKDGYLTLTDAEAAEFEDLLRAQPIQEQVRVQKLAHPPATMVQTVMIQGIDHSGNAPAAPAA